MRRSRKNLAIQVADHGARIERLIAERDNHKQQALDALSGLRKTTRELSDLKDEIALTIVACRHPASALSDARSVAIALQEALVARGIDIRLELARLEGADL